MQFDFDAETIAKIYTPIAAVIGALWRWYVVRDRAQKKAQSDREARCERERREDQAKCERRHERLEDRLNQVQTAHTKDLRETFVRVADALETMSKRNRRGNDPDSEPPFRREVRDIEKEMDR